MPTTSNFGWTTPADTDLVKDGAAAIRTLGNGIDTSLVDLKGGTTGQVLSKASNTDLDYSWVTPTDQTPLTTKGDLFTFTTVDARLGVGANGTVLTADSSEATGLKWATPSSGGMTLLSTTSLTTSSTAITGISQSYTDLLIEISAVNVSGGVPLSIDIRNSTTDLDLRLAGVRQSTAGNHTGTNLNVFNANLTSTDARNIAIIRITNYISSTRKGLQVYGSANDGALYCNLAGAVNSTSAVDAFFVNVTNNPTAGSVKIWGIK